MMFELCVDCGTFKGQISGSQVWYCVPPGDRGKFEHMARSIMMGDHKKCKGFLRHKEVLISPTVLRQYHVDYVLVRSASDPDHLISLTWLNTYDDNLISLG
jgi:hypothetical protein